MRRARRVPGAGRSFQGARRAVQTVPLLSALLVAAAGCGTSAPAHPAPAHPAPGQTAPGQTANRPAALVDGCVPAGAHPPRDAAVAGERVPIVMLGKGSDTVILSDESDENLCSWLGFARQLAGGGYRVVLWDYGGEPPVAELTAVVAAAGGSRVILVGASEGAKTSLITASRLHTTPLAVVSLSAEAALRGTPVAPAVRQLPCPALLVTSAQDPYGSAAAAAAFMTTAPRGRAVLYKVPGDSHGTALLTGPVIARILRFLHDRV